MGPLWLVQVQSDGRLAYRTIPACRFSVTGDRSAVVAKASAHFSPRILPSAISTICAQELPLALMQDGLFPDEAAALIETWNQCLFPRSGLAAVLSRAAPLDRSLFAAVVFRAGGYPACDGRPDRAHQSAATCRSQEALADGDFRSRMDLCKSTNRRTPKSFSPDAVISANSAFPSLPTIRLISILAASAMR